MQIRNFICKVFSITLFLAIFFSHSLQALAVTCLPPRVIIGPASHNFGSVNVGESRTQSFSVTYIAVNDGPPCPAGGPPSTGITVSSDNSSFTIIPASFTLNDWESRTITITFSPNSANTFSATIVANAVSPLVRTDRSNVLGVGLGQPNINLNTTSLDFGDVRVNTSTTQNLVISNEGNVTLTSTGPVSASGPFAVSPSTFSIAPGSSQTLSVTFSPTALANVAEILTIISNDPDAGTLLISLNGNGTAPDLQVSPASHNFGTIPAGETSTTTITISNPYRTASGTSGTLSLSSFQITGSSFNFTGPVATSLEPGDSTTLQISFNPITAGVKNGTLTFNSNDPWNPTGTITLSGTAVIPSINPSTLNLSWGDVHVGTTGTQTLTISNNGGANLAVTGFTSPTGSSITVSPTGATIAPRASRSFSVRFAPPTRMTLSGNLMVFSNDTQLPSLAISLAGSGMSPNIYTSSPFSFGNVSINPTTLQGGEVILSIPVWNFGEDVGSETLVISNVQSNHSAFTPVTRTLTVPLTNAVWGEGALQVRYRPTALGDQTATLSISSNDYAKPVQNITLNGTGVSFLDLSISKLEVTQSIQTEANDLPLILGKPTAVRTFITMALSGGLEETDRIRNVDGRLRVFRDGTEVAGSPFASSNGPIDIVPTPDRGMADETLNFILPASVTSCASCNSSDFEFRVEINPTSGGRVPRFAENNYGNNTATEEFTFFKTYRPRIDYIPLALPIQGLPLPPVAAMSDKAKFMEKIFPIPGVDYNRRPPLSIRLPDRARDLSGYDKVLNETIFRMLFIASHLGNQTPPDRSFGWFPVNSRLNSICGRGQMPGKAAWGACLSNPTFAQETFAHEIGHTYGLCHTHVADDCNDNHLDSEGTITEVGFDLETGRAVQPVPADIWQICVDSDLDDCSGWGTIDFMAYKGRSNYEFWINPQRYRLLYERLKTRADDPSNLGGSGTSDQPFMQAAMLVSGTVFPDGTAEMDPLYTTDSVWDMPPSSPTATNENLWVRAVDAVGSVILEYPLTGSIAGLTSSTPDETAGMLPYSFVLPNLETVEAVQVVRDGVVLSERRKTNNPPVINLLTPAGGQNVGAVLEVTWSASDPDGDSLVYSILYSKDGGATFETIGVDIKGTSIQYDTSHLGGSENAIIRVLATDGFNSAFVDSPPFRVGLKPPELSITSPQDGVTLFSGAPVVMEASASDLEDGPIPPENILWSSDIAGNLGTGNPLNVILPLGNHVITATTQDSDGNQVISTVQVTIADGAIAPRAQAGVDLTVDEGDAVQLDGTASTDPNEDSMTYEWTQTAGPTVDLDDFTSDKPAFITPSVSVDSLLQFRLTVTDPSGNTSTDSVDVAVTNSKFAEIHISALMLDFGNVPMGGSKDQTVTLSNSGNEALKVTGIEQSQPVFGTQMPELELAPGASTAVTVRFSPADLATYEGSLRFISNSIPGAPNFILLKGSVPAPSDTVGDKNNNGDLLPEKPVEEPPAPESIADGGQAPGKNPGSFQFSGIGGCSLKPER